jgi:hypothetical protein
MIKNNKKKKEKNKRRRKRQRRNKRKVNNGIRKANGHSDGDGIFKLLRSPGIDSSPRNRFR